MCTIVKGRKQQNENAKKQICGYYDRYILYAFNDSFNDANTDH